jgi:DNA mismatch repair ATPase MutS
VLHEKISDRVQIHRVLKNGVYLSMHELRSLGSSKQDVLVEYKSRQGSSVDQAMKVSDTFCPMLEQAISIIGESDASSLFAHVVAYQGGSGGYCRPVRPVMTVVVMAFRYVLLVCLPYLIPLSIAHDICSVSFQLVKAHHPFMELWDGASDFIPYNFQLNHSLLSFQSVTGPSMGGKSTYIHINPSHFP